LFFDINERAGRGRGKEGKLDPVIGGRAVKIPPDDQGCRAHDEKTIRLLIGETGTS